MRRRTFVRSTLAAAAGVCMPRSAAAVTGYRPASRTPQDVVAITGTGEEVTLAGSAIAELKAMLRGRLLLANDEGFDEARRILNPSFDRRPALIAQVTGPADIRTVVDFARENRGLLLAVKCGGHSASGQSTCDRGVMIDLSPFRAVRVDPAARRAWVTGGSLLGLVDHETASHGLVTTLGTVSHTGVGGLVTGGGFGRLARRFGMAIDNVESVDVVTADGRLVHASASENPDLFWGVRGGGGNFGVVTSFEFRLHPMQRTVLAGQIRYPARRARDVFALYASYAREAPDELQLDCMLEHAPGGGPATAGFGICYSGAPGDADRVLAPLRSLGTPLVDEVAPMPYVAVQKSGDISDPRAQGMYLKSGFVSDVPADMIAQIVDGFESDPTRFTALVLVHGGGAIERVAADATAFPQRGALANMLGMVGWRHGTDPSAHTAWIKRYWQSLEPFTHGFYVNDVDVDATASAIRATYRHNHERLVGVKNRYDPKNLFRLNANVAPTV